MWLKRSLITLVRIVLLPIYFFDPPFGSKSKNLVVCGLYGFHSVNPWLSQYDVVCGWTIKDQELGVHIHSFRIDWKNGFPNHVS